ncbi:ABC transporter permease [Phenylobacterium sp.]|uniref:ABC transporter permease n=1 Tax=Phenylobacterium sp. TaxID=1871053 RepID=UPI0028A00730|nr:ABC transporter permease [Phenylobacterium sp.]
MTSPIWLIAAREFRAYATTGSFWLALAIGPLLTGGGMLLVRAPPPPQPAMVLTGEADGGFQARFSADFPLSPAGRAQVLDLVRSEGSLVRPAPVKTPAAAGEAAAGASRFLLLLLLWVTLVGSLGMLLQASVRERANRALEILLSAARPLDIVLGKVLGVGAVSVLVVATWLAAPVAMAFLAPATSGPMAGLLQVFADPLMLLRAGVIYLLAFGFFGFLTVMVGAMARDSADAQNLARPMFAVLLVAFFVAMTATHGGAKFAWLVYLPPFTPFMLLAAPVSAAVEVFVTLQLALATVLAGWGAGRVLHRSVSPPDFRWPKFARRKTPVRDY